MAQRGVKDFLGKPAPPGYIAGLGRGASGFITRPDLGTGANLSLTAPNGPTPVPVTRTEDDSFLDNENDEGLLAVSGPQGAEDEEADAIYARIEARLATRRQSKPKATLVNAHNTPNEDASTLFSGEKLKLRQVTAEEWLNLPESGDFITKRAKKNNGDKERYMPVPDSVLLGGLGGGMDAAVDAAEAKMNADFRSAGETRGKVLGARLDTLTNGLAEADVNAVGYLERLAAGAVDENSQELKKVRSLLRNAVQSNPTNPSAWISLVRVEESSGNISQARSSIADALQACPDEEDIWIEAIRLAPRNEVTAIVDKALHRIPKSVKLWLAAVEMRGPADVLGAKRLLRRALTELPKEAALWKALVEREEDVEDAKQHLVKAVEHCPHDVELWIGLARLENYENARKVINRARQLNPTRVEIWLAAARLEEAHSPADAATHSIKQIISRAIKELSSTVTVDQWIEFVGDCEASEDFITAKAIASSLIDAQLITFEECISRIKEVTAKSLLDERVTACQTGEDAEEIWLRRVAMEASSPEARVSILQRAVQSLPRSAALWKEYIKASSDQVKVEVVTAAANALPDDIDIQLEFITLSAVDDDQTVMISKLKDLVSRVDGPVVWHRSVHLIRLLGEGVEAIRLIEEAIKKYPTDPLCWIECGLLDASKWTAALEACPKSIDVRLAAARSLICTQPMRTRAILEQTRTLFPTSAEVWIASLEIEMQMQPPPSPAILKALLTRALQKCPTEGDLWVMAIDFEPRPLRKSKAMEALRRCGEDHPLILMKIAQLMEADRNLQSAAEYYAKATASNCLIAEVWGYRLSFSQKHQSPEEYSTLRNDIVSRIQPREGRRWTEHQRIHEQALWKSSYSDIFDSFLTWLTVDSEPRSKQS